MTEESHNLEHLLAKLRHENQGAVITNILDRSTTPTVIVNQDWIIIYANHQALSELAVSSGSPIGKPLRIIPPLELPCPHSAWLTFAADLSEMVFVSTQWEGQLAFFLNIRPVVRLESPSFEKNGSPIRQPESWQTWADAKGELVYVSSEIKSITGYNPVEFQQNPSYLEKIVAEDDKQSFLAHREAEQNLDHPLQIDLHIHTASGEIKIVRHTCQPIFDHTGYRIGRHNNYQDITEFQHSLSQVDRSPQILDVVSLAVQQFSGSDWKSLLTDVLSRLGEAAGADRVLLLANVQMQGSIVIRRKYGWQDSNLPPQLTINEYKTGPLNVSGLVEWEKQLRLNQPVQGHIRQLPHRQQAAFQVLNILSTLIIPIFVGQEWWGVLQFDTLRGEKTWTNHEVRALQSAGNLIGATLQREQLEEEIKKLIFVERRRSEISLSIHQIGLTLNSVLDAEVVLDRLPDLIGPVLKFDTFMIWLLTNGDRLARARIISHRHPGDYADLRTTRQPILHLSRVPTLSAMAQNRQPMVIPNVTAEPTWVNAENHPSAQTWVGAPLLADERLIGFVTLSQQSPGGYTSEDAQILAAICLQAGRAWINARMFDDVAETLVSEQRLNEITQIIASSLDLPTVLQNILQLTIQLVSADAGTLALLSPDKKILQITNLYNLPDSFAQRKLTREQGVAWTIIDNKTSIFIDEYGDLPKAIPYWVSIGLHAFLGVPLIAGNEVLGTLNLYKVTPHRVFREHDRILAEMVARQAGITIQNARRYEEAQRLATRDSMTGLFNRRYFFEVAHFEFERARRYDRPVSAIMLDLDNLKLINDRYGHQAGDLALQTVAKICQTILRQVDLIGRYGGDEYVIFLPETNGEQAKQAAERLRKAIADTALTIEDKKIQLTISVGAAALHPGIYTVEELIDQADQAQYKAKHSGKNKVEAKI